MQYQKAYGEPPWLLVSLKRNCKYHFHLQVVAQYLWVDIACWKTDKSAHKGWRVEGGLAGGHMITPWCGIAVRAHPGRAE